MKRKILFALLCCLAVCTAALAFTACTTTEKPETPQYVGGNAATCTAAGNTAYWIKDGKYYSDEACTIEITVEDTVIPALQHDFENGSYTSDGTQHWKVCARDNCSGEDTEHKTACSGGEATCTEKAVCTVCTREYGEVNAQNHVGGTEVKGVSFATCSAVGYTGDTYCLGCDTKISDGTEIPATGEHDFDNGEYGNDGEQHWKVCANEGCTATDEAVDHQYDSGVCGCGYEHTGHADENDDGACDTCDKELSYEVYFTIGTEKYTPYKLGGLNQNVTAEFGEEEVTLTLGGATVTEDLTVSGGNLKIIADGETENTLGKITVTDGSLTIGGTGTLTVSGNSTTDNGITSNGFTVKSGATLAVSGFKFDISLNGNALIESGATVTLSNADDVGIGGQGDYEITVNGSLTVSNVKSHAVWFRLANGGTLTSNGTFNAGGLSVVARTVNVTGGTAEIGVMGSGQKLNVTGGALTVNGNVNLSHDGWGQFKLDGTQASVTINGTLTIKGDNLDDARCYIRQGRLEVQALYAANIIVGDAQNGCGADVIIRASGDAVNISATDCKNATYKFEKGSLTVIKTGEQGKNTAFCLNQGGAATVEIGEEMTVDLTGHQYSFGSWNSGGSLSVNNLGTVTIHSSMLTHNAVWTGNGIAEDIAA